MISLLSVSKNLQERVIQSIVCCDSLHGVNLSALFKEIREQ